MLNYTFMVKIYTFAENGQYSGERKNFSLHPFAQLLHIVKIKIKHTKQCGKDFSFAS